MHHPARGARGEKEDPRAPSSVERNPRGENKRGRERFLTMGDGDSSARVQRCECVLVAAGG